MESRWLKTNWICVRFLSFFFVFQYNNRSFHPILYPFLFALISRSLQFVPDRLEQQFLRNEKQISLSKLFHRRSNNNHNQISLFHWSCNRGLRLQTEITASAASRPPVSRSMEADSTTAPFRSLPRKLPCQPFFRSCSQFWRFAKGRNVWNILVDGSSLPRSFKDIFFSSGG